MEWDTAAADIIVKEAGGAVVQAGKVTGKGELLEDWKVRGGGGRAAGARAAGGLQQQLVIGGWRLRVCCRATAAHAVLCECTVQEVLAKELPMEYNKEDLLNPCFVVFGRRR